jgi:hypothetical protein
MQKKFIILPALLLVFAVVITGCPSEPDPAPVRKRLGDANILFVDGIFQHEFSVSDIKIEDGKEYEIVIDIKELEYDLAGCHFQGQLIYEIVNDGEKETWLLAGSQNAQPQNIAIEGKKYRLTFKAGDLGDASDGDTVHRPATGQATTPEGAKQFLRLEAKTPRWYKFGVRNQPNNGNKPDGTDIKDDDNWDGFDYYRPGLELGAEGEITIRLKPAYTFTNGATIDLQLLGGSDKDLSIGKGNIEGDEFTKLKDLPAGSVLRVNCTANVVTSGGGGSNAQPGWGIAEFGTVMTKIRGQNQTVGVGIPEEWEGAKVGANSNFVFYVDILIEDILDASDPNWTFLSVYNGGKVTGMQIRRASQP